jgi:hypothetical protein
MIGNEVAKLAQKRKLTGGWLGSSLNFHALPCGRAQTRKPTIFYPSTLKPTGLLWSDLIKSVAAKVGQASRLPASAQPMQPGLTLALQRSLGRRDARPTLLRAMPPSPKHGYSFNETALDHRDLPKALSPLRSRLRSATPRQAASAVQDIAVQNKVEGFRGWRLWSADGHCPQRFVKSNRSNLPVLLPVEPSLVTRPSRTRFHPVGRDCFCPPHL